MSSVTTLHFTCGRPRADANRTRQGGARSGAMCRAHGSALCRLRTHTGRTPQARRVACGPAVLRAVHAGAGTRDRTHTGRTAGSRSTQA
eukprot:6930267-Prymnesium_polylepis.1